MKERNVRRGEEKCMKERNVRRGEEKCRKERNAKKRGMYEGVKRNA
jgi:hypothetical protein